MDSQDGSGQRTCAVGRSTEIVSGKSNQIYGTQDYPPTLPPPPSWGLSNAEMKRKKRITRYKAYTVEGKVKSSLKKGFRWIKNKCSHIVHAF